MFKTNLYYRIRSIERNKKYSGTNFWNAGYSYQYTPISCAVKYIGNIVNNYNKNHPISHQVEWCVVKSSNEQEMTIKFTGKKKDVYNVVKNVFETDIEFVKLFAMENCPSYYI